MHEDLLLLMLLDREGRPVPGGMNAYPFLIEAALLAELVLRERILVNNETIMLLSSAEVGDESLDAGIALLNERPDGKPVGEWLFIFAQSLQLTQRLAGVLLERGDVHFRSKNFLGKIPMEMLHAGESERWDALQHRLDQAVHGDILMDDRLFATLCLLSATPLLGRMYPRRQMDIRKRLKKIVREISSFDTEENATEIMQRMLSVVTIATGLMTTKTGIPRSHVPAGVELTDQDDDE
jgi:hypothetical protein